MIFMPSAITVHTNSRKSTSQTAWMLGPVMMLFAFFNPFLKGIISEYSLIHLKLDSKPQGLVSGGTCDFCASEMMSIF